MSTKTKSKVKTMAHSGFRFRWWMGVLIVLIIAVAGIAILQFSHAGRKPQIVAANFDCPASIYGIPTETVQFGSDGGCYHYYQTLIYDYQLGQNFKRSINTSNPVCHGNYDCTADGRAYYGKNIEDLTKYFQKANGLTPDGIVGTQTWGAIIKACYVDIKCY